ncbi:hypothetical protein Hanom_Chr08g00715501 [Helianthus anomalus]
MYIKREKQNSMLRKRKRRPFQDEGERSHNKGGKEVSIGGKSVVIHAMVKSSFGYYD